MTHVVIFGAAPSGLYLASKLRRKGVQDIRVFDPRAGNYGRPGAIDSGLFNLAEQGLKATLPPAKSVHIRNIEKSLYQYSLSQNISIEKKQFVRFAETMNGVVVAYKNKDDELIEEFIACDYVFDCTGTKRALVSEINRIKESKGIAKPFEVTPVSKDVVIKNHLIAYLKLDQNTASLADNTRYPQNTLLFKRTPLEYTRAIEKLRQFGWTEFAFPYCYNTPFKEGKSCIYVECPDNLPLSQKEAWLTTVLKIVTHQQAIQFEQLNSKNGHPKPNFCVFAVNPKRLNCFTYQEQDLPNLVVLGDGQIEPNYTLGHGIRGAFERINILVEGIIIYNRKITSLNFSNYNYNVNRAIKHHEQELIEHYQQRKRYFRQAVYEAKGYYQTAISQASNEEERQYLSERLNEILARTAYYAVIEAMNSNATEDSLGELLAMRDSVVEHIEKLTQFEQQEARSQLQLLVNVFTGVGNELFQEGNFYFAVRAYEEALAIYSMHKKMNQSEKFSLYGEIVLSYRKLNQLESVFAKVQEALSHPEKPTESIKKKILFHFVKATYENIGLYNLPDQQLKILTNFVDIYKPHQDFIDKHLAVSLMMELKKINEIMLSSKVSDLFSAILLNSQDQVQNSNKI
ncbi:hypothetical protein ACQUW5_06830 [Legionella sp. CNM-1927-20]|uniref:hypothetical protein n=1 Tax=Legionella sp. CNM-1927-20 TaxID=3422221 RepID=UPI00403B2C07